MSRIGNKHIDLPAGVTLEVNGEIVTVKGPKGSLEVKLNKGIDVHVDGSLVTFTRQNEEKQTKQNHGTTRANVNNAIVGVTKGYSKTLEMRGIGYKAVMKGESVELFAGYSHTIIITPDKGVKISLPEVKGNTGIVLVQVDGIDKQAVGQTAARIRNVRRPEPYLGKGIRYQDEYVATKEGKRATK